MDSLVSFSNNDVADVEANKPPNVIEFCCKLMGFLANKLVVAAAAVVASVKFNDILLFVVEEFVGFLWQDIVLDDVVVVVVADVVLVVVELWLVVLLYTLSKYLLLLKFSILLLLLL